MSSNTESSLKILLVDDDELWVKTMKVILEAQGEFIVETALSGEEALDILKKWHPHIVLLDLNLGEDRMDGIECLAEMRDSGYLRSRGLYPGQLELLSEFMHNDYPRIQTLSEILGVSETSLRNRFKRIREKLCMESLCQVVHMLSAVEMAGRLRGGGGVENSPFA